MGEKPKHMTATEVRERERLLFSRPTPELDAAAERALGPMIQRMLDFARAYKPKE